MKMETNYNIHNIVRFSIARGESLAFKLFSHLDMEYDYFKVPFIRDTDMTVKVGDFVPDTAGCTIIDNKYYIKKDYIYFEDSYKLAKWEAEITGFEDGPISVRIKSNFLGHLFYDGYIIEFLVKYIALRKGYLFVHGTAVEKDGQAVLFPARSGTGKTTLAMNLVKRGWKYMGDDLVIVDEEGFVYSYPTFIHVFSYHLNKTDLFNENLNFRQKLGLKLKYLLYRVTAGYAKLFSYYKVDEILPDAKISDKARLKGIYNVFIKKDGTMQIKDIKKEVGFEQIMFNMRLESYPFNKYLEAYGCVFPLSKLTEFWAMYSMYEHMIQASYKQIEMSGWNEEAVEKIVEEIGG